MARHGEYTNRDLEQFLKRINELPTVIKAAAQEKGLESGGQIIKEYLMGSLQEKGLRDTDQLLDSISADVNIGTFGGYTDVGPSGSRKRRYKVTQTGTKRNGAARYKGRYNGSGVQRNAEVAFILEYGSTRLHPTRWMSEATEAALADVTDMLENLLEETINHTFGG